MRAHEKNIAGWSEILLRRTKSHSSPGDRKYLDLTTLVIMKPKANFDIPSLNKRLIPKSVPTKLIHQMVYIVTLSIEINYQQHIFGLHF